MQNTQTGREINPVTGLDIDPVTGLDIPANNPQTMAQAEARKVIGYDPKTGAPIYASVADPAQNKMAFQPFLPINPPSRELTEAEAALSPEELMRLEARERFAQFLASDDLLGAYLKEIGRRVGL